MFDYFKKIAISNRADDELLYEYVLNEMESGIIIKGLWGKSLANSDGNEANAKSIYMKYRVQSIKDIFTAREIAYNELSKPKLFQYIQDKILSSSNNYADLSNTQSKPKIVENYKASEYEESIYSEVAEELSNDIRKEGLWLKAIQNTDGDENRALSLYVEYRSEAIRKNKLEQVKQQREKERVKLELEKQKKEDVEKEKKLKLKQEKEKKLPIFLEKHNLKIIAKIGSAYREVKYINRPIRSLFFNPIIVYKNNQWNFDGADADY